MEQKINARKRTTRPSGKGSTGKASANGARSGPRLTGDLLSSSLLAYLRRWNTYGYQLVQELGKAGVENFDSTTVYRTLRQLERSGLVSSFWDTSESGPARRMYAITKAGDTFLDLFLDTFTRYQNILQSALNSLDNPNSNTDREAKQRQENSTARRRRQNGGR
ncbi:MAG: helix-turn-helix transcriptional regulator [Chloroflexi bacterium]|nr:helix-turn-helix transcriptional regulator [Chloroflexota bacterium]